jgi:heme/copper-type cytochrome/quinol oxidase subunit 3
MKISRILIENVVPNTIGAILFIGYFILKDKLTDQAELESCERFYISNTVYLIFVSVIVLLSSLYQIIIGNWILKRNESNFVLNIVNIVTFGIFFTLVLIIVEFVNKDVIEVKFYGEIFLSMFFLALLNLAFKKICGKLFGNKFAN